MENKSIMDCGVKNFEKTFDIKQKTVDKLHNMQWLKNMPHSSNPPKIKIIYKHIQEHENNKLEDKDLLIENIKTYSTEESDQYQSMDTYKSYLPNDAVPGSIENMWDKDVNLPNTFPNSENMVNQNNKEEDILMITKSIVTTKLDAEFYTDKMQKDQSNMSQNNAENITQDVECSNLSNFDTKSDKTANVTYQNKNINKDGVLRKQQTVSKQSTSKMQESLKENASMLNYAVCKNKTFKKTEKVTNLSKNSNLHLNELEKKSKKIVDRKHFPCHQKADCDFNLKKNTTFVVQNKNSAFTKTVQNKGTLRNIQYTSTYGRNSSHNDPNFDNKHIGNSERKSVTKREYIPTNVFFKSNVRTKELCTNNLENWQNEMSHIPSTTDIKSTTMYKKDATCNNENNANFVNAKTCLTEDEKCVNSSNDYIRKQEPMYGQNHEEKKQIDKSKVNIEQNIQINNAIGNEQTNSFKDSFSLFPNRYIVKKPVDALHQHSSKLEHRQHMNDAKKLGSTQTTWCSRLSNNTVQKNVTIINSQQSPQNTHFNVQQTIMQARDQRKQVRSWESNSSKFYNQHFLVSDAMRPSQIPNTFTGHSTLLDQTVNSSIQNNFHVDSYNATRPAIMHIYNSGAFASDEFNNTHIMNCPPHPPVIYTPPLNMQTQSPQLQYSLPVFSHSSYANYIHVIPDTINQLNNSNSMGSMYYQQLIPNVSKFNQHYEKHQDNSRMVYNLSRNVTTLSHPGSQPNMNFVPATTINQWQNQRHNNQNAMNYKQNFVSDDNESENIPPILSPKEFVTNNLNFSNKID